MIWKIFDKYSFGKCHSEAELFRSLYETYSLPSTKEVKDQIQMHATFRNHVTEAPDLLKPAYRKVLRELHRVFYMDYSTGLKHSYGKASDTKK
jgi:hypothetical protein